MESHSAAPEQQEGFRDLTTLANWTRGVLYASIAVGLAWTWMDWTAYQALVRGDTAQSAARWAYLGLLPLRLAIPILVLTWIHRANLNVRALGATGLKFAPGWAVGWYFVPIAFFWKPFQAMREIWRASRDPDEWQRQPGSVLLGWWWALWILTFFGLDTVTSTVGYFEMVPDPEVFEAAVDVISDLADIPLMLILIMIIGRVHRMQMAHHRRQVAAGSAAPGEPQSPRRNSTAVP